jgi:hypothetical protein
MLRALLALTVTGGLAVAQPPAKPTVYKGTVKDVLAADGTLNLTEIEGGGGKDRAFPIARARIIDEGKSEIKIGDLRPGDRVEVEMDAGGKIVNEVRVIKRKPPL